MSQLAERSRDPVSGEEEKRSSSVGEHSAVGLIDPRPLRRQPLHSVLCSAMRTEAFRVHPFASGEELLADEEACRSIGTVLLNLGAEPLTDPDVQRQIGLLVIAKR